MSTARTGPEHLRTDRPESTPSPSAAWPPQVMRHDPQEHLVLADVNPRFEPLEALTVCRRSPAHIDQPAGDGGDDPTALDLSHERVGTRPGPFQGGGLRRLLAPRP